MLQYLVRHGRSVSNQEGRVQGRADVALSPDGRRQAAAMADWVRLDAGIFQGHLWAELEMRFPDEVARWRSGDAEFAIPGGESRAQLAARGRAALESLAARAAGAIVVVAHGGILTAALGSLLGRTHPLLAAAAERPFTRLPALDNCSVSTLRWPGPDLLAFNDTGHLAGMTADDAAADAAAGDPAP